MDAPQTNGNAIEAQNGSAKIPAWLTADKFDGLLRKHVAGYHKIKSFHAKPAMSAGENYATLMLRIEIVMTLKDSKESSVSYMLKVPLESALYKDMLERSNIFSTERGMYMDVVPEMEQMLSAVGVQVKFGAQCYVLSDGDEDIDCILLEDLRPRGFKNADRRTGLDMEHTKSVLKKLAQWHAASATRVATKGPYADIYSTGFFVESNKDIIEGMMNGFSDPLLKCLKTYDGYDLYGESVIKTQTNMVEEIVKMGKVDPNEFNVLNHGDCWCNNVMFQYDEDGRIRETYLVDYQIPKYGSPAQDLYYFLLSSTQYDLKLKYFDVFIKYYHHQLVTHLKLLKYPKRIPTLRDIHIMMYKYGAWGYTTVTGIMPVVLLDPSENANLDNFIGADAAGNAFKMQMFSNPRYRKHAEALLPWLYYRGAIECSD